MSEQVIEIKTRHLKNLYDKLNNVWLKHYVGRFKGALSKLNRALDDDAYEIEKMLERKEEYNKYLKALNDLNERSRSRNTEGQIIPDRPLPGGAIRLTPEALKEPDKYFVLRKQLDTDHKDAIEQEEKRISDFNKKWNESVKIAVKHLIRTEDYLTELSEMTGEDYNLLVPFLDRDIEEFDLSKIEERKIVKLQADLDIAKKRIDELKTENRNLEDRNIELRERLTKLDTKKE